MNYWKLTVSPTQDGSYDVFYKTPMNLSTVNVPRNAVVDGDLVDSFMMYVSSVEKISEEIYFASMNE